MYIYIINFFVLLILLLVYFRIARKLNIIDKPNERSSHTEVTLRGGGIIFPIAVILWFFEFGFNEALIILAATGIALISFIDDIKPLSSKIRILAHFTAVSILFWQINLFDMQWYIIVVAYILTAGWINAFNFMDGINGISGIYALVALVSFSWLNSTIDFISAELINTLIISTLIFLFFNARKQAKTFAGDIGSISLAFLLAWFLFTLILKTQQAQYLLFFAVYGIDSVVTIIFRLYRRENIFKAHRSHLYQFLSNELKVPHLLVASFYGFVQLVINTLVIIVSSKQSLTWSFVVITLSVLLTIYLTIRLIIQKEINREEYLKYAKNKG